MILNAITGLASAFLGRKGAKEANQSTLQLGRENMAMQREFAQKGIQWRVADAKQAGLHPLAALGASTHSFSPVSVGQVNEMEPVAEGLKAAGQNISRALRSNMTQEMRDNDTLRKLNIENQALQNERLRNEIRSERLPPAIPNWTDLTPEAVETRPLPAAGVFGVDVFPEIDPYTGERLFWVDDGEPLRLPPHYTSLQDVADYFGDTAQEVTGIPRLGDRGWDKAKSDFANWWRGEPPY